MSKVFEIPPITDARLKELAKRIKPVVRTSKGELFYIKPCDLRGAAFTWGPVHTRKATALVKHATITTLHTFGFYGFFKPSVAEVLAQIPEKLLENTIAFEVIGPADADALNKHIDALNAGFHTASTYLYTRDET